MQLTPKELWRKSERWRAIARKAVREQHRLRALAPKCGAFARTTGHPCQNPLMGDAKRCHLHGGRTPRGDDWHRPQWPDRKAPDAMEKIGVKLTTLRRRENARKRRVAAMSPDERAAYEKHRKAMKPGTVGERKRRRQDREQAAEWRRRFGEERQLPASAERTSLLQVIGDLEARRAELARQFDADQFDEGVFG